MDNCLCFFDPFPSARSDWPGSGGSDFHLLKGQRVWSFLFLFYYDITRVKCGGVRWGVIATIVI